MHNIVKMWSDISSSIDGMQIGRNFAEMGGPRWG